MAKSSNVGGDSKIPVAKRQNPNNSVNTSSNFGKNSKNKKQKQSLNSCGDQKNNKILDSNKAMMSEDSNSESISTATKKSKKDKSKSPGNQELVKNKIKQPRDGFTDLTDSIDEINDEWSSPVQNLFLWSVSAIFMFAFFSFYYQVRGLYGNNGVLPLRYFALKHLDSSLMNSNLSELNLVDHLQRTAPSLVWHFSSRLGLSLTLSLEFVALLGTLVSFLQLMYDSFRGPIIYSLLFALYYSCVNVGQTFLYFQWDAFLLEVGALTILISIRLSRKGSHSIWNRLRPHPSLVLWTARWLLFKFMLSSGIVKFTARCPLWWSLRSLDVHFESQPLPTPLAWYAHQLPKNWLHLSVAIHFVIEIAGPFLFFTPFKSLKLLSFASQVFLQLAIMLTGNYNFFNMLTIVLCFCLLDDSHIRLNVFGRFHPRLDQQPQWLKTFELFTYGLVVGVIGYFTVYYFDVNWSKNANSIWESILIGPETKVNFTYDQFNLFVTNCVSAAMLLGMVSLFFTAIFALFKCWSYGNLPGRVVHSLTTLFYITICAIILSLSMVPLAELDTSGYHIKTTVPPMFLRWYRNAQQHHLMSSYGLFRTMTGDGGRPELIIEGSNDSAEGQGWKPFAFKYKPGDLYRSPIYLVPHQPRLDWQMWFAALGSYQENPWLINLCYRLMTSEPDVLDLLDRNRLPFPEKNPPKFLRISRYLYKFTDSTKDRAWWRKVTNRHAYLPMVTLETLESALKLQDMKLPKSLERLTMDGRKGWPWLDQILNMMHSILVKQVSSWLPPFTIMILLASVAMVRQLALYPQFSW